MNARPPENPVLLATIGGAHGIKGEVRVKSFTADARMYEAKRRFYARAGLDRRRGQRGA